MRWTAGSTVFEFPRRTLVMGIVNVTPDSFSDGGKYLKTERALEHALTLAGAGADILDIGGESTRPGATEVDEDEEMRRVLPVLKRLAQFSSIPLSIDTRHPRVAEAAIEAGATIVNDIAANRTDPTLWEVVARHGVGYVAMHMQGTPKTMQRKPTYEDVVEEVRRFFEDRLDRLSRIGVDPERVVLDPGIGFGKNLDHNLALLQNVNQFHGLQRPIMLGVSRKSFISKLFPVELESRLAAGLACTLWAVQQGVQIFRTHDVEETVQALRMNEVLKA